MHWNNWPPEKMFPIESRPVDFVFQTCYAHEIDHGEVRQNEIAGSLPEVIPAGLSLKHTGGDAHFITPLASADGRGLRPCFIQAPLGAPIQRHMLRAHLFQPDRSSRDLV